MSTQGTPPPGTNHGDPVQACPFAKHVIEVLVVDDYDTPVDAWLCGLRGPAERRFPGLDLTGWCGLKD